MFFIKLICHITPSDEITDEFHLQLELSYDIVPQKCTYKVLSSKVECKIIKEEDIRWGLLEKNINSEQSVKGEVKKNCFIFEVIHSRSKKVMESCILALLGLSQLVYIRVSCHKLQTK